MAGRPLGDGTACRAAVVIRAKAAVKPPAAGAGQGGVAPGDPEVEENRNGKEKQKKGHYLRSLGQRLRRATGIAPLTPHQDLSLVDEFLARRSRAKNHTTRSTIIFLISAIAFAGFSPLGQVLAQFMIVWQR